MCIRYGVWPDMPEPTTHVYVLSNYGEDGAEEVQATFSRASLPTLLEGRLPDYDPENQADAREKLAELLQKTDEELASGAGHNLMSGWGGEQLHVVRLT